jgi:hypothetical protein
LTDVEHELEEVAEPVFVRRGTAINVHLEERDAKTVERMAQAKGVSSQQLVRAWVLQKIARRNSRHTTKRSAASPTTKR